MLTRRQFVASSATVTAASLFDGLSLEQVLASGKTQGETEHFWWRIPPDLPYIDSQRGSKAFAFDDKTIFLSEDNAKTWPHQLAFKHAAHITFSQILGNGNILFATRTRLYLSADKLKTFRQITVQRPDGKPDLPHKPLNPNLPGWYFHPLDGEHCWDIGGGQELTVWGNYCNVLGGAVPVSIYSTADYGQTVKLAYRFGVSPRWQQKGAGKGEMLGDPSNPVIARHIHSVAYNPSEDAFYACTGDHDERDNGALKHECHWLRGKYDRAADAWAWQVLVSDSMNTRYKSGGINFVDGKLYWCSDANGPKPHDRGIFRSDPKHLADQSKHEMLFNPKYEIANMLIEDGVILSGHYTPVSPYNVGIIISPDLGKNWAQYDLKGQGKWSPVRFHRKNAEGWVRIDLRERWIKRGRVMFIKPKSA